MTKRQNTNQTPLAIETNNVAPVSPLANFSFNVESKTIGSKTLPAIRSSEIHVALEVKTPHTMWVERRISEYNFVENQDFLRLTELLNTKSSSPKARPQQVKEVWCSIEMAKMLCMIERTAIANEVRKYFIQVEDYYIQSQNTKVVPAEPKVESNSNYSIKFIADETAGAEYLAKFVGLTGNQAVLSATGMIRQKYDVDILKLTGQTTGLIAEKQMRHYNVTEIGKQLKPSKNPRIVNKMLESLGYQLQNEYEFIEKTYKKVQLNNSIADAVHIYKDKEWKLTPLGQEHAILVDTMSKHSNGMPRTQIRWYESIVPILQAELDKSAK